jgi:subtilase family protein/PA domain-containing protein/fibronectin type III domain protein
MHRQRFAAFVAVLTLVMALLPGAAQSALAGPQLTPDPSKFQATSLTPDSTYVGTKSPTAKIAETDPALLGRTDSNLINVMIKYDYDATASYAGGVAGLAATSPSTTGKKLKNNKAAVDAYENHAKQVSTKISAAITAAVPQVTIGQEFVTAYGGVSARVPANAVAALLRVSGVAAVQNDSLEQPLSDATQFIGATEVWPTLGGQDSAASNVVVGVIDTGIWPEHPFFEDRLPPFGRTFAGCQFGNGTDPKLGPAFACNDKLVAAYAKTATYMANVGADANEFCNNTTHQCSARDPEGHGTHTASTAAGDRVDSAILYGVERGPVSGVAPGARVIMYRVCLEQGCFSSDSVSAVNQAIADDVDVINFSISGGRNPYSDSVELAFLDAFHAGISVNASGGNSGPGAATVDHGGPWVTTVGASTSNRFFTSTLRLTAAGGATFDMTGVTITKGIPRPTPVVLAQSIAGEDALCQTKLAAGAANGKIVACRRGVNARVDKGFNVFSGGAAGMILYNSIKQDVETDNHWLPAIHVDGPSTDLLAFINGHNNVRAMWAQGTETATQGDVMAAFSSRGPQDDFIKPDVTAPGIQVLAGMTPQPTGTVAGPSGQLYQAIAGTSMSSPHSAGASALIKAAHPDWTPAMIKSALMTSAAQGVVKEDGVTSFTPFDAGSGSIRVNRAVNPTVVFNETFEAYQLAGGDALSRINLNLASVNAPTMTGKITTKRSLTNVSGLDQTLGVSVEAPSGATISVSKSATGSAQTSVTLKSGETTDIWITISGATLANGQYFGRITLDAGTGFNDVTIPVAFFKRQGAVTLTHTCNPTTFNTNGSSRCEATVANFAATAANVELTVTNPGGGLTYSNVTAPATATRRGDSIRWSGTLSPAVPPQVTSITPTTGPAGGYLSLSAFGIAPISGVGDDTITNFNTPTFFYGAEAYSRVGVVSNGYLVIGGGTASDVVFTPQIFPNTARPNNTLALLWSDLNPPAAPTGGGVRIATLTDGSDTWIVVDWNRIPNFSNSTNHTFEIWLRIAGGAAGTGASSEQTTFTYGAANTASPDPGSGGNSGAENRVGTSGQNLTTPADGTEWSVNTVGPTAGGSETIGYDASSRRAGTYTTVASMTSDVTPGTTQVVQTLTVTNP